MLQIQDHEYSITLNLPHYCKHVVARCR